MLFFLQFHCSSAKKSGFSSDRSYEVQNLPDKIAGARESRDGLELMKICREVLDFHGEMVLLENYSAINYIGN